MTTHFPGPLPLTNDHHASSTPPSEPQHPRFSMDMISYRTDSPDSSRYLARVPSIYHESNRPYLRLRPREGGQGHIGSDSLDTGITGHSLPSSLAHYIEPQRAAMEAALAAEQGSLRTRSVEISRSGGIPHSPLKTPPWTAASMPVPSSDPTTLFLPPARVSSSPIPISPSDSVSSRGKSSSGRLPQSRKSTVSTRSYSTVSSEPATRVYQAQHARKASASSHNLLARGSISSLLHAAAAQMGSSNPDFCDSSRRNENVSTAEDLNRSLGALPWPELPPRSPSFHSSPGTPTYADESSLLLPVPNTSDRRVYSFLESDPLPSGLPSATGSGAQSHRSSRSSASSHSRSASRARGDGFLSLPLPPKDVPISPALSSWSGSGLVHPHDQRFSHFTLGGNTVEGERPVSVYSGMADVDSTAEAAARTISISASAKSGSGMATGSSTRHSTKSSKSKRSKSTRSAKSGKSNKSKRVSIVSSHHRLGRWEIEEDVPLVTGYGEGEWRDVDSKMDLERLVARSLFQEKLLMNGKRVSAQSLKKSLQRRLTASTKRSSLSTSHKAPSWSHPPAHRPSNTSAPPAFRDNHKSRTSTSSSSIARIRLRLSRRIPHRTSQEDAYTEIGSNADQQSIRTGRSKVQMEEDDPSLFPAQSRPVSMLPPLRNSQLRGVQHAGITVFPEEEPVGPPTPPKPAALMRKLRTTDIHPYAPVGCIPLHSPSTYDYSAHEKQSTIYVPHPSVALRESYDGPYAHAGDAEKGVGYRQSPHLGHRSPGWRDKRASLASYISTGHWDGRTQRKWIWGVVIGGGIVLILIIGLVSGLLGRRSD